MKSKKSVIKDVVKPTSISPKSNFTDPNDPWSAKANVAENITSKRANLLKQFYKSKGWNVDYITKNKKVSQSKTGEYEKWKRDHGIYEEDQIDEVSNELLGRYKTAAGNQASELDKAGGKENIQKANKRFSGIVKATKKQFANDDKKQSMAEAEKNPHTSALGRALWRDLSKEKKASPQQVQRNKERWAQRQAEREKNVAEGLVDTIKKVGKALVKPLDHPTLSQMKAIHNAELKRELDAQNKKYAPKDVKEDSVDPQAATQSPADCANGGETLAPPKKSIKRVVKELYSASRQVQEDLYDWEKDDKAAKPYGKKPTTQKLDGVNNIGDDKPNARLILKGGKTLTGEPRDTVEIDPMLKNRSKMPDYKSMDKIKQKPQEQ